MNQSFEVWFDKLGFLSDYVFEINPVAFSVFGKSIAWYGIVICLGMVLAYLYSSRKAKHEGISTDSFIDYVLFTVPIGIIGARLFYVLPSLDEFPDFPSMLAIWNGGLAITGGIVFGLITVICVSLYKKHNFLRLLDALAPGVLLAQAVGRWGNFFNGEVFGVETALPWAMSLDIKGIVYADRHPLFFYEFALNLIGVLIMHLMYKKKRYSGQIVSFYLAWYGIIRSLLELLRDSNYQLGFELFGIPMLFSQLITILMAIIGITAFILGFILKDKFSFLKPYCPEPVLEGAAEESSDETEEKEENTPAAEDAAENTNNNTNDQKETENDTADS